MSYQGYGVSVSRDFCEYYSIEDIKGKVGIIKGFGIEGMVVFDFYLLSQREVKCLERN